MPTKNGSCLNEEYTEAVTKIHALLKEAKEIYDSLPSVLKSVRSEFQRTGGEGLNFFLTKGECCARSFAKEFGITIDLHGDNIFKNSEFDI